MVVQRFARFWTNLGNLRILQDICYVRMTDNSDFLTISGHRASLLNKYTLFDGLTYNTRGYFTSCVVFFPAAKGRGKIRAMSKMSARIIC